MQYSNDIKRGYLKSKERLQTSFPEAHDFLTQIESLFFRGFHVGTHLNLNLYYKSKFIFYFGIDRDYVNIRGKPMGILKHGTEDYSSHFFSFFVPKLSDFKNDTTNTLEIFDENNFSFWINKTGKSKHFFSLLLDSLVEYSDNDGLVALTNEINEVANQQQIYVDLNNPSNEILLEGIQKTITATIYERNPKAREECLKHWKYSCLVCGFNFEKTYGELGKNYIHVHHIRQISTIKKQYEVDPINDLRPLCPNCHAMIHRNKDPLTIEELKSLVTENGSLH